MSAIADCTRIPAQLARSRWGSLALGTFNQRDHPVQECFARIGGDLDPQIVTGNLRATGDRHLADACRASVGGGGDSAQADLLRRRRSTGCPQRSAPPACRDCSRRSRSAIRRGKHEPVPGTLILAQHPMHGARAQRLPRRSKSHIQLRAIALTSSKPSCCVPCHECVDMPSSLTLCAHQSTACA